MKHKTLLPAFLSIAAFAVGCDRVPTTAVQNDTLRSERNEATTGMKDFTFTEKTQFTAQMQSQLAEINKDLDQLAAKLEKSSDAARTEAKPKLQALREKADRLAKQLGEARNATESTWDDVKAASKKAYKELKDGFQQARQWVSEQIAP